MSGNLRVGFLDMLAVILCVCLCECVFASVWHKLNTYLKCLPETCDLEHDYNNKRLHVFYNFFQHELTTHCVCFTVTAFKMLQQCIIKSPNGALGLNLSRAPWDPYPWVSGVQAESNAQLAGVCIGDTLLQLNGIDVLGMRISELANKLREHWLTGAEHATMMMWRQQTNSLGSTDDPNEAAHAVVSLHQFASQIQPHSQHYTDIQTISSQIQLLGLNSLSRI